jgi:SAM-dependent methyltransferase
MSMKHDVAQMTWEAAVLWLREQPDFQQLVMDAYYDDPLQHAAERYRQGEEWQEILKIVGPEIVSMDVLDVGAGRGISSYAFAKTGARVSALEPDPSSIVGTGAIRSLATAGALEIAVVENKSETLPFAENSFDIVFARAVLHHADDLPAACGEFFRVLKKGGRLIAVREHVISRAEDLSAFFKIHPLHALYGGENAYLLSHYQDTMASAGFELLQTLSPFSSAINYAPHTRDSLIDGFAAKLPFSFIAKSFTATLKKSRFLGDMVMSAASRVDHRPGRLYSFVARRPY